MAFKISGYQFVINPVHSNVPMKSTTASSGETLQAVKTLTAILGGDFEWVLSGGIAIPLSLGIPFYRQHRDIDLGVHKNHLKKLTYQAASAGYRLFSRLAMFKISPNKKLDFYKQVTPGQVTSQFNVYNSWVGFKNLRLVRTEERGRVETHNHLLSYFDIFVHDFLRDRLVSFEEGMTVPISLNMGGSYETPNGTIKLRNLQYITKIKERGNSLIDKFDLQVMHENKLGVKEHMHRRPLDISRVVTRLGSVD